MQKEDTIEKEITALRRSDTLSHAGTGPAGNLKDDVFDLSVSGYGRLGSTPAGGLRKFGLNIAPGSYTATVTVVSAPDNVGTFTLLILENGTTVGSLACSDSCPEGSSSSVTFTVTGE
ncbi:MAG: hypothetical protein R6U43_04400 [Candidatus Krumholzibacteriales bacterium]